MTTLNLPHLKEAALAATPGPWKRTAGYGVSIQIADTNQYEDYATYSGNAKLVLVAESKHGRLPGRDADFIAAANPAAVLELIERLEAAEAEASHFRSVAQQVRQQQIQAAGAMPNDPLDDVLPLPSRDPNAALNLLLRANGQPPFQEPGTEGSSHG